MGHQSHCDLENSPAITLNERTKCSFKKSGVGFWFLAVPGAVSPPSSIFFVFWGKILAFYYAYISLVYLH